MYLRKYNQSSQGKSQGSALFLRLPRRIQYFAANRVAPYLPLFSMFQPEDKETETNGNN